MSNTNGSSQTFLKIRYIWVRVQNFLGWFFDYKHFSDWLSKWKQKITK